VFASYVPLGHTLNNEKAVLGLSCGKALNPDDGEGLLIFWSGESFQNLVVTSEE